MTETKRTFDDLLRTGVIDLLLRRVGLQDSVERVRFTLKQKRHPEQRIDTPYKTVEGAVTDLRVAELSFVLDRFIFLFFLY